MPESNPNADGSKVVLRRHGDAFERLPGGFYQAHGRTDDTMNLGGIKTSSVELERVCSASHPAILETAAVSAPPPGGGPEALVVYVVLREGQSPSAAELQKSMSTAIKTKMNPLFKLREVKVWKALPRTATNKVMRRVLREDAMKPTSKL